jgi:hypothetical protein
MYLVENSCSASVRLPILTVLRGLCLPDAAAAAALGMKVSRFFFFLKKKELAFHDKRLGLRRLSQPKMQPRH